MHRVLRSFVFGALALGTVVVANEQASATPVQNMAAAITPAVTPSGEAAPIVENVWWRRGWGWRRPFYGYYARPFFGYGYGWRRPWGWYRPWGWRRW